MKTANTTKDLAAKLHGLSQAEVDERVRLGQTNDAQVSTGRSVGQIIHANVATRINAILGILLIIVLFTGSWINGAFGLLIVANSAVGIIQELRARATLSKLKLLSEDHPTLIRNGEAVEVPPAEVVVDDIVLVTAGDTLAVDATVVAGVFDADESQLTGESDAVIKRAGDECFSGTVVTSGSGAVRAVKVGADSYANRIAAKASEFSLTDSALMDGINRILKVVTWLLIPTGILTIISQLFRSGADLRDGLLAIVAALVPMVPEGLVLMTSVAFAAGVIRLGKYRALVNELVAIEGLARVDTVCTDKTGTLTTATMELHSIVAASGQPESARRRLMLKELLLSQGGHNDTAAAILDGLAAEAPDAQAWKGEEIPFRSATKYSGFTTTGGETFVLGAPEMLLVAGSQALETAHRFESEGLRVLAFGAVDGEHKLAGEDASLVILEQELRDDAAGTLAYFARENVDIKVISGDNAVSVGAVAARVSGRDDLCVIDARQLPTTDNHDFDKAVARGDVFGRVTPEQKQAMVEALHRKGRTVAMTGDGVNDVLALKKADIGVAMGSGSAAARSVAQLVLLGDRFSALPAVVAEGRRVIGNIERVATLFLTKTVYSVITALIIAIAGLSFPFQPIHVTLTGWFTIGIPAFVLSLAPNHERPRDGFVPRVLRRAVPAGVIIGIMTVIFWITINPGPQAPTQAQLQAATAVLFALIIAVVWVLGVVSRPWNLSRILLVASSYLAYALIFFTPIAGLLLLDPGDHQLMITGGIVGVIAAVLIEIAHRIATWKENRSALKE